MSPAEIHKQLALLAEKEKRRKQYRAAARELTAIAEWHRTSNKPSRMIPLVCQVRTVVSNEVALHKATLEDDGTPALFDFQLEGIDKGLQLLGESYRSCQLIAPTGSGKTYFAARLALLLRKLYPDKYPANKPIIWLTKPSIVRQSCRVHGQYKLTNLFCFSYPQMVSSIGRLFVTWTTRIVNNTPTLWPDWNADTLPSLVIVDEAQAGKNMDSQQSMIMQALVEKGVPIMFMSATPYSRPIHTRLIATALCPLVKFGYDDKHPLTDRIFPTWIASISAPKSPLEWCPAAMRRIQDVLEPYTIRFGKLKYKHRCFIKQMVMAITNPEKRRIYNEAFEEYQEKRIAADLDPLEGFSAVLVAMMKFRQISEIIRADDIAELIYQFRYRDGKLPIAAFSFVDALKLTYQCLLKKGVKEDEIALIMGGQSAEERQRNIDEFQSEKRKFMLLSFNAGGAGLSLHQYEPVNTTSRVVVLPPVWNSEDLVQVLGRAHRCNSGSTTYQYIVWYSGTIEEEVCARVKHKCEALKEVARSGDSWADDFAGVKTVRKKIVMEKKVEDEEEEENFSELPVTVEN